MATSPDKVQECQWELEADTEKFIGAIEVCEPPGAMDISDQDRKSYTLTPGASIMS